MTTAFPIKRFDVRNASEKEYRAANLFGNTMRAEQLPDDPPIPLDEQTRGFQNIPNFGGAEQRKDHLSCLCQKV